MPEPVVPTTCPVCNGSGYLDENLCSNCFGGGSIPIKGIDSQLIKKIFILVEHVEDILDKCNDIFDKCQDIMEKLNET